MDSDPPPRTAASASFNTESSAADPGEDPFSTHQLQSTGSSLIGALIALLALALPIASVVSDRHDPRITVGATESMNMPAAVGNRPGLRGGLGGNSNVRASGVGPLQP
ncbi:MAG: hypothetical protein WCK64_00480 [Synechococcaceae cyanobacterium ELA445]|jgi:hypothetical protein